MSREDESNIPLNPSLDEALNKRIRWGISNKKGKREHNPSIKDLFKEQDINISEDYSRGKLNTRTNEEEDVPFFENKPKQSIDECCRQFYDSSIFHAVIAGTDVWSTFLDTTINLIAEVDSSFFSVDTTLFRDEMTALRMEIFALAWSQKFKQDKYIFAQSFFTRSYLEENSRLDIWNIMLEYNQIVAMSATTDANGKQYSGRIGISKIGFVTTLRDNLWKDWEKRNIGNRTPTEKDEDNLRCLARVINRVGADINREDCVVVKLLSSRLSSRLGCGVNLKSEALFSLASTIFGFYKGSEEYLKSVYPRG